MRVLAAFDFDKTLTVKDTFTAFLFYTHGILPTLFNFLLLTPYFILYLLGRKSRSEIKEIVTLRFYKGAAYRDLKEKGERYARNFLSRQLNPLAAKRLKWHQGKGHRTVIISASLEVYLGDFGKNLGVDAVLCTRLEFDENQRCTGKLIGGNCWGAEKVNRLKAYLGVEKPKEVYAYGDSRGDQELLEYATHPFYRTFSEGA